MLSAKTLNPVVVAWTAKASKRKSSTTVKVLFLSPLVSPYEKDRFSTFENCLSQHLRSEVVRLPAKISEYGPQRWLDEAREHTLTADVLLLMSPSGTLCSLGGFGSKFVQIVNERIHGGVPAIVQLGSADLPENWKHDPAVRENLENLYRSMEARPTDIRVSKHTKSKADNDYSYRVDKEDLLQPDYIGEDGQLLVNQARLLIYDGQTFPLVLAQTDVELIDGGDLKTSSVPGVKPAIALYRKVARNYQVICTGGIFNDGYTGATGQKFPGAEENVAFIERVLDEVSTAAPTFENRAHRAYRFFVRSETGVGRLLQTVFDGLVGENLTTLVQNKLKDSLKGDLGRLTLLDMLEAIRSKSRWARFESGMKHGSEGRMYSRKEFCSLVEKVNNGARNVLAHPAKSVFSETTITDSDIKNLEILDQVIWNARKHFGCTSKLSFY